MIVVYNTLGKELGRYDNVREIEDDYPDIIEIHNGKAIVKEA